MSHTRLSQVATRRASSSEPTPGRCGKCGLSPFGHASPVVIRSLDIAASQRFFTEGIGFKLTDTAPGLATFSRCSADHHNLLLQAAPVNFLQPHIGRSTTSTRSVAVQPWVSF